ncbi:hypothetical protein Tco_0394369 [Tanacetum coccineum]
MNLQFDELTQMASEQHGSGPELYGLTSGHISSRLVLNQATSTSVKPPTKNDWDLLFQPMFDEYFKLPSAVSTLIFTATLLTPDTVGASSSTSINKDAPSPSTSPNIKAKNSPITLLENQASTTEVYITIWSLKPFSNGLAMDIFCRKKGPRKFLTTN